MKRFIAMCAAAAILTVSLGVAAEEVVAYYEIIEVTQTPMSDSAFCTLLTGTYCEGSLPEPRVTGRMYDPTRFDTQSPIWVWGDLVN